jgi:hypothetical protein
MGGLVAAVLQIADPASMIGILTYFAIIISVNKNLLLYQKSENKSVPPRR